MRLDRLNDMLNALKVKPERGFERVDRNSYSDINCEALEKEVLEYIEEVAVDAINSGYDDFRGSFHGDVRKSLKDLTSICVELSSPKASAKLNNYRKQFDDLKSSINNKKSKGLSYSLRDELVTYLNKTKEALILTLEEDNGISDLEKDYINKSISKLEDLKINVLENVYDSTSKEALDVYNDIYKELSTFASNFVKKFYNQMLIRSLDAIEEKVETWSYLNNGTKVKNIEYPAYSKDTKFVLKVILGANRQLEKYSAFKQNITRSKNSKYVERDRITEKTSEEIEYEKIEGILIKNKKMYKQGLITEAQLSKNCEPYLPKYKSLQRIVNDRLARSKAQVAKLDATIERINDIQNLIVDIEIYKDRPSLFMHLCGAFPIDEFSNYLSGVSHDNTAIQNSIAKYCAVANEIIKQELQIDAAVGSGRRTAQELNGIFNEQENKEPEKKLSILDELDNIPDGDEIDAPIETGENPITEDDSIDILNQI